MGNVKRRKADQQYWSRDMERKGLVLMSELQPYCGSKDVVRIAKSISDISGNHCCLSCGLIFDAENSSEHSHTCAEHAVFSHLPAGWEKCLPHLIPSTFVMKTNISR